MKKSKMILLLSLGASLSVFSACMPSGEREDNENVRSFSMRIDTDIFQFQGDGLEAYKLQINKNLKEAKGKALADFKGALSDFIEDESYGNTCMHELIIESKVFSNNSKFLSVILHKSPFFYGANGTPLKLESFNYIIKDGKTKRLNLDDIFSSKDKQNQAFLRAVEKIRESDNAPQVDTFKEDFVADSDLLSSMHFGFKEEYLQVEFQPYSIASGASGLLVAKLKYSEIQDLLNPEVLEIFSH